jgi:hypothetical protein
MEFVFVSLIQLKPPSNGAGTASLWRVKDPME